MKKLNTIITSFLIVICLIIGVNSVKAASFLGTINNYDFNNFSLTFNGNTYTKEIIYNKIDEFLGTNNTHLTINSFKYIFISVPTQPQTSGGDARGYIYIDLFNEDYNITNINFGQAWSYSTVTFANGVTAHLKIKFADGEVYSEYQDITTNVAYCIGCMGGNRANSTTNIYTNLEVNTSMIGFQYTNNAYSNFLIDTSMINSSIISNIVYQQGEVIMANYENATANLVTQYIFLSDPYDTTIDSYTFKYTLASTGETTIYEPKAPRTNADIGEDLYFNIPLAYNTTITYTIEDENGNVIYTYDFNAYLNGLFDSAGFRIYELNNYKYANISYINNGKFALTNIEDIFNIYVEDTSTGDKIDFLSSQYFISESTEQVGNNEIKWYNFDFQNNTNLYLTIYINGDMWNYKDSKMLYLYAPNTAYVHLSGNGRSEETQDNPVNSQAYKDSNGDIHYNPNPIMYDGEEDSNYSQNFYTNANNIFLVTSEFFMGVTTDFALFINSLSIPIRNTIFACFTILIIAIVIGLFKH